MTNHVKKVEIQKHLPIWLLLEDIVDWVLFTLSTTCFIKANLGETLSSKARISFSSNLPVTWWRSARSVHSWASARASWLVSRRNVCTQRPFVDWPVASNRLSTTLLLKHRIHYFNVSYTGPAETTKIFGQWIHKFLCCQSVPVIFPQMQKSFVSVLSKRVYEGLLRM